MSNFVQISTSVADILSLASGLRAQGKTLTDGMKPLLASIEALERDGETFPPDEFTSTFLGLYHQEVDAGDGTKLPASEAVKQSAGSVGAALTGIADYVATAMWNYQGTDEDSATDIGSTTGA
jgi:hypothetical protein